MQANRGTESPNWLFAQEIVVINFFLSLPKETIVSVQEDEGAEEGARLCRWSASTGCSIAVDSCWPETQSEAGTPRLMASRAKTIWTPTAPHRGSVEGGGRCSPVMAPTNRNTRLCPKSTRATRSEPPNTACWLSSPWTCSSSFTGQLLWFKHWSYKMNYFRLEPFSWHEAVRAVKRQGWTVWDMSLKY